MKKNVVKKEILHEQYRETLFGKNQLSHGSEGHNIFGMNVNKTSLSAFDSKRWIEKDGVNTNAFGYNPPPTDAEMGGIMDLLNNIFGHNPPPTDDAEMEGIMALLDEVFGG